MSTFIRANKSSLELALQNRALLISLFLKLKGTFCICCICFAFVAGVAVQSGVPGFQEKPIVVTANTALKDLGVARVLCSIDLACWLIADKLLLAQPASCTAPGEDHARLLSAMYVKEQ